MKITKGATKVAELNHYRKVANIGCDRCPICGESKSYMDYLKEGVTNKGIFNGTCIRGSRGFFKIRATKIDCYSCKTCGAEWQSEEYYTS